MKDKKLKFNSTEPRQVASKQRTTDTSASNRPAIRLRTKLILSFSCLVMSLIAAEVGLRIAGKSWLPPYPLQCYRPEMYQEFKPYGYRLWPSRSMYYLYPQNNPRKLSVVSNSDGFRNSREFDASDNRLQILVVGDSFVFGEGVEESERFTNILETLRPAWRVDNLGMTGYGPDLMLRAFEEVGLRANPDILVLCMYTDDFRRVRPRYPGVGYEIPRFKLASNRLVSVPYPRVRFWYHLHLFQGICHTYWRFTKAQFQLNRAILDRFLVLGEEHGFDVAIIFLPGTCDKEWDRYRRSWLCQYAREHNVAFLDLSDTIHAATARQELFIPGNPHWNPYGHRIAATEIAHFLTRNVVQDRRSPVIDSSAQ